MDAFQLGRVVGSRQLKKVAAFPSNPTKAVLGVGAAGAALGGLAGAMGEPGEGESRLGRAGKGMALGGLAGAGLMGGSYGMTNSDWFQGLPWRRRMQLLQSLYGGAIGGTVGSLMKPREDGSRWGNAARGSLLGGLVAGIHGAGEHLAYGES